MITSIDISDLQAESYKINNIEVVFEEKECYVLTEDFYIPITSLSQVFNKDNSFFIVNLEDKEDSLSLTQEEFNVIKDLLIKKGF
jgi:hypothetical protein